MPDRLEAYRQIVHSERPDDGHAWGSRETQPGDPDRMSTVWPAVAKTYLAAVMLRHDEGRQ